MKTTISIGVHKGPEVAIKWDQTKKAAGEVVVAVLQRNPLLPRFANVPAGDLELCIMAGRTASRASGDVKGYSEGGAKFDEGAYDFRYFGDRLALIVIPGMNMTYHQTIDMQAACNRSFGVEHSTRIRNYSHGPAIGGDIVQSAYSEFGAIDNLAIATAVAISRGFNQKKKVYIVAHSQGTEIFKAAMKFILLMEPLSLDKRREVARHYYKGSDVEFDMIPSVGDVNAERRKNIHYQGFGSETYIHQELFGLGSVRNVKTKGDYIPVLGVSAKSIIGGMEGGIGTADLLLAPWAASSQLKDAVEKEGGLLNEHWEYIETRVQLHNLYECLNFSRHDFFTNYWPNIKVPIHGDKPDMTPFQLNALSQSDLKKLENKTYKLSQAPMASQGGSVVGKKGSGVPLGQKKKKEGKAVVAIFIDGSGNQMSSGSNIAMLYQEAFKRNVQKDSDSDDPVVRSQFLFGPELTLWDPSGVRPGLDAVSILERAYSAVVERYNHLNVEYEDDPQIDIFGFGRGAAVASELAWVLHNFGMPDIDVAGSVKVRFLGLFEPVHSMVFQRRERWHAEHVAPNVDYAAMAFAGQETRTYLKPSFLKAYPGPRTPGKSAKPGAAQQIHGTVFPGVHDDIGGGPPSSEDNANIMKLARSWMLQKADEAGVRYLDALKATEMEIEGIKHDPLLIKPGPMRFPDGFFPGHYFRVNPASGPKPALTDARTATGEWYYRDIPEMYHEKPFELFRLREFPADIPWLVPRYTLMRP